MSGAQPHDLRMRPNGDFTHSADLPGDISGASLAHGDNLTSQIIAAEARLKSEPDSLNAHVLLASLLERTGRFEDREEAQNMWRHASRKFNDPRLGHRASDITLSAAAGVVEAYDLKLLATPGDLHLLSARIEAQRRYLSLFVNEYRVRAADLPADTAIQQRLLQAQRDLSKLNSPTP